MAASLSFELEQFQQGYFIAWEVLTQCANTVNVTLKAGGKTYFSVDKTNHSSDMQLLSLSSDDYRTSDTMILTVTVNESSRLKQSLTSGAINNDRARKVGYSYSLCIEDAHDDDFNDVYVNIVGWAKKG